jgi:hypothetical protein
MDPFRTNAFCKNDPDKSIFAMNKMKLVVLILTMLSPATALLSQERIRTQVLVVGGGTGGTTAGIQSARMGVRTLIAEEGPWLGGMLSAAGVSAIDGNHHMPSGLWGEFRDRIYGVYGGPGKVATGWVSFTLFEPRVADSIWKWMAGREKNLTVRHGLRFVKALREGGRVTGAEFLDVPKGRNVTVTADRTIDASELGDVMASAGIPFDLGMEASSVTGEKVNVPTTNDIIQDMTFAAILKDHGPGSDRTLPRPADYDSMEFDGCCRDFCSVPSKLTTNVDKQQMLDYGRLPNGKYMINWPGKGNDIYLNMVPMSQKEREQAVAAAKAKTLRFVYFIQRQLGFKHLGLAEDEFPTADRLPLMPYHREGRRLKGVVRFDLNHISKPYEQTQALYRTGVSVGDYPVDHHHRENLAAPQHLGFYPVPSFNIPLGALIPAKHDGIVVCEKGISVSNVANGTTRLQPVVMLTGQAAGTLAAASLIRKEQPRSVPVRLVQEELLKSGAYLMPYYDVKPLDPHFDDIQRIGATGILKGRGEPFQWANRTWFQPDSLVGTTEINEGLSPFGVSVASDNEKLTVGEAVRFAEGWARRLGVAGTIDAEKSWMRWGLEAFDRNRAIRRVELAVLLNRTADPFDRFAVDHTGGLTHRKK